MSTYVSFRCGDILLYLDARGVRAITECDHAEAGLGQWQDQALEQVNLNATLGQPGRGGQALVVAAQNLENQLMMLSVDSVDNVVHLEARDFRPLPPLTGRLGDFF